MTCVGRQIEQRQTFRKSQQEKSSASHLFKTYLYIYVFSFSVFAAPLLL